jgi:CheY-like chemotaxis protein
LTGNLEDLPLLDILQIVSFSRKTGFLVIQHQEGAGAIVFSSGLVVAAFTPDSATTPGADDATITRRIEVALAKLARLREGQFNFNLTDVTPQTVAGRDVMAETLDPGLNAQELLIDLARGIDEDRRDSSAALEASFADEDGSSSGDDTQPPGLGGAAELVPDGEEPEPTLVSAPASGSDLGNLPRVGTAEPGPPATTSEPPLSGAREEEIQTLLLVDDEDDIRQFLTRRLTEGGYQVVEAADPDTAIKKAKRLGRSGISFVVVTDLGMPTSGGSSFQGGFEIIKRLWKMNLRPPVLLMTETVNPALKARAKQMGVNALLFKPGLSRLDPDQFRSDLQAFGNQIVSRTLPRLVNAKARADQSQTDKTHRPLTSKSAPEELSALQRRLRELREPYDATQISALVMKVAREFFERGILFLVKQEDVRGLGGFGPAGKGDSLNLLARQLTIPLGEPSIFHDAVATGKPFHGQLPDSRWHQHLMGKIGRFRSSDVALLPLVAYREPIALLFGDNPETGRPFDGLEALEIFITQAAIALENAFLQRKLQTVEEAKV